MLTAFAFCVTHTDAQSSNQWSLPFLLSNTDSGNISPSIVTDASQHVFAAWINNSSEQTGTVGSIFLTVQEESEWKPPVDVIAPQGNSGLQNLRLAASNDGLLYLLWQDQSVKISAAPIGDAMSPHSWSEPVTVIAPQGIDLGIADLAIDNQGVLHVSYPDQQTVYYTQSTDGGLNWSTPVIGGQISNNDQVIHGSRIAVAGNGDIYLAWNTLQLPDGWPPQGVYVAVSKDGGFSFDQTQLEGLSHNYVSIVVSENDTAHAVWNTAVGLGGRYESISQDQGATWTRPNRFTELSGSTQLFVMLMFDPWGNLHLGTIADGDYGGVRHNQSIFYMSWDDRWSSPELVASLPKGDAHRIAMTVSEGNRVHILWQQGEGGIWYSTKTTSMSELPVRPLPTSVSASGELASVLPKDDATPVSEEVVIADRQPMLDVEPVQQNTSVLPPILLSSVSALVVIGIAVAIRRKS